MGLRLLLVALVTCLGFEWPGLGEFAAWGDSGRAWISTRVSNFSSFRAEARAALGWTAEPIVAGPATDKVPADTVSGRLDLAFEAVVEGMASGFASNLAQSSPVLTSAELAKEAETQGPEEPTTTASFVPLDGSVSRFERISTAVRLTRQAVDAWASLIEPTPASADDTPIDSF